MKKAVIVLLCVSCLGNISLALALLGQQKEVRTVFVPPVLKESFWVDSANTKLDPKYIEQMGLYVLQLHLNVSPASVQYQGKLLLDIVDPRLYKTMEHRINVNAAALKNNNVTTVFDPAQVFRAPDQYPNRIGYGGTLFTLLGDKQVSKTLKTYMVEFGQIGGKTYLIRFEQTPNTDPLGVKLRQEDAQ